jgi:hypothetical protein
MFEIFHSKSIFSDFKLKQSWSLNILRGVKNLSVVVHDLMKHVPASPCASVLS